jgi:tetratricopeptide (TPR) repeat protein
MQAAQAYRNKEYNQAINFFLQSIKEPMTQGSPNSDGQIFSNLGMAYSAKGQYFEAYECLTKAFNLGIRNDNVIRELQWLKNNVGLG